MQAAVGVVRIVALLQQREALAARAVVVPVVTEVTLVRRLQARLTPVAAVVAVHTLLQHFLLVPQAAPASSSSSTPYPYSLS
jgi:hypothetical protein